MFRISTKSNRTEYGGLLLTLPLKAYTIFFGIVLIMLCVLAALSFYKYKEHMTVRGLLVNTIKPYTVYSDNEGIIKTINVSEGDVVQEGDVLFTVSSTEVSVGGDSYLNESIAELEAQLHNLALAKSIIHKELSLELINLDRKNETEKAELAGLLSNRQVLKNKIALIEEQLAKQRHVNKVGGVSELAINDTRYKLYDLEANLNSISTSISKLQKNIEGMPHDRRGIEIAAERRSIDIDTKYSEKQRLLIDLKRKKHYEVTAPLSGVVTNIMLTQGQLAVREFPALMVTPQDSEILAELYVPSRNIGFLTEESEVKLRFDAYPYQIYGDLKGEIDTISKNILFPNDWNNPLALRESVYLVRVKMKSKSIKYNNKSFKLKSGFKVTASLKLGDMSIADYLVKPLKKLNENII